MKTRTSLLLCSLAALVLRAGPARAESATDDAPADVVSIERLVCHGLEDTREQTLEELLPRRLPTHLSRVEIVEFERRVRGLALFDSVDVHVDGAALDITVTEKGTIVPLFFFAGGRTVRDSVASLGVSEFNAFGAGTELTVQALYEQRALSARLTLAQHVFRARSFSYAVSPFVVGSEVLFPRARDSWTMRRYGASARLRFPFAYGMPFRFALGAEGYHERVTDVSSRTPPPDGTFVGARAQFTIDDYTFHDLVPHGYMIDVGAVAGALLPRSEIRARVEVNPRVALPLWSDAVLIFRGYGGWLVAKTPNATESIDSNHIRGLSGVIYHADALAYVNAELRQSYRFTSRWAMQFVPLADVGGFRTVSPSGKAEDFRSALSFGAGVRLVPTLIAVAVLRIDAVRMVMPEEGYVILASFDQFF